MLRYKLLAISVLMLLAAPGVSQEQTPNFSGTWRINFQKTKRSETPPEDERLIIEQNGSDLMMTLLVRSKGVDDVMNFHYIIGAKDVPGELHGGSMKSSAQWQGDVLKIDSVVMYSKDPLKLNDLWSISKDGQTLTFNESHQFMSEPAGQETDVFDRQPDGSWIPPSPSRPAEEVYKNIQVLKGVPASRLPSVMVFFTRSLGVDCTHCHVPNDFPKDDKSPKQRARLMLKMVHQINDNNFPETQNVSCWTCHRGSIKPESLPH